MIKKDDNGTSTSNVKENAHRNDGEEGAESDEKEKKEIDISPFFEYQTAINSLINYLNRAIEEMIVRKPRSDQVLFNSPNRRLILNAILEAGFYRFCQVRFEELTEQVDLKDKESLERAMESLQGEMDLLAFLLVQTRLAHRTLNFDLYLSLLKGGLLQDIMNIHKDIVQQLRQSELPANKGNLDRIKVQSKSGIYI